TFSSLLTGKIFATWLYTDGWAPFLFTFSSLLTGKIFATWLYTDGWAPFLFTFSSLLTGKIFATRGISCPRNLFLLSAPSAQAISLRHLSNRTRAVFRFSFSSLLTGKIFATSPRP